jgi:hypothetical protein
MERDNKGRFIKGSSGFTGSHTEDARDKMSKNKKGKKTWIVGKSKEEYPQLSNSGRKRGCVPWNKGLTKEEDERVASLKGRKVWWGEKISKSIKDNKSMTKEKNPNWQGGISYYPYPEDWTESLRESIRERDNYICQLCGIHQDELDIKLDIHHIDYDKNNLSPRNLISLCRSCHLKTNYDREEWCKYFNLISKENE